MILAALGLALAAEPAIDLRSKLDVTGVGEVYVAPDEAVVTLGVRAQADSADKAFDDAATAMADIVAAVSQTVPEERIRTSQLSLQPQYDYTRTGTARLIGYEASAILELRVDEPTDAGRVVDDAVAAGANEVQSIAWVVEDEEAARQSALDEAVADARRNAEDVAANLGVRIVTAINVNVRTQDTQIPPMYYERGGMDAAADVDMAMPVLAGEQIYRAEVTVTFEIEAIEGFEPDTGGDGSAPAS